MSENVIYVGVEQGNMTRGIYVGNTYCIVLLLLSAIVSAPHSTVTIKAASNFKENEKQSGVE